MTAPFRIGYLLFPNLTQLDLTGPFEVMGRLPGAEQHLVWKTLDPVKANSGLSILPTATFDTCPPLDLICVPGGPGTGAVMEDEEALAFLRRAAAGAKYTTSVCTGSMILAAAGLLRGKRAACHWMSRPLLADLGAIPVAERVVVDGSTITGGGVTAGIDFGLAVIAKVAGEAAAQAAQLMLEYDPDPPFDAGSPETAPQAVVARIREAAAKIQAERAEQSRRIGARLAAG